MLPLATHDWSRFTMPPLAGWPAAVDSPASDHEVVELQLLLPQRQAVALEAAARARGMTTGQILRRVIADLFPVSRDGAAH